MGFLDKLFGTPSQTVQGARPEQLEAMRGLLDFAKSGDIGYGGNLGYYTPTDAEQTGQNKLLALLQGGLPSTFNLGKDQLNALFSTDKFDPYSEKGTFAGFKENVLKEGREASDRLKHNAAFAGNLYSTDTIKNLGKVEENVSGQLNNRLAELYDTYTNRQIGAIPLAFSAGQAEEGLNLGRIGASQQYGGLDRILQDEEFRRMYEEFVRGQGTRVGAYQSILNSNVQPDVTLPGRSGLSNIANAALQGGAMYLGTMGMRR